MLSQSTNDRNRDVAYLRLRERFETWEAVRDAPVEEVEEAIRPGGISKVKSVRIQAILRASRRPRTRRASLDWLPDAPVGEARDFLCSLPGRRAQDGGVRPAVRLRHARHPGRHARLARRLALGLFRAGAAFDELHDAMLGLTPPGAELGSTSTCCATAGARATRAARLRALRAARMCPGRIAGR